MMLTLEKLIRALTKNMSHVAALAIISMMCLTCADIVLRFFGHPIAGTYEIVGFLATFTISFSLAHTSMEKGHIAVEILFQRLPFRVQYILEGVVEVLSLFVFIIATWQCAVYGFDLKNNQDVSATLAIPVYPVVLGIALGCASLCLVITFNLVKAVRRIVK
jgi:TRAP-type C4-dicarboxylate transport system permease small subunit